MGKTKTLPWDVIDHWETDQDILSFLKVVLEESDGDLLALALGRHRSGEGSAEGAAGATAAADGGGRPHDLAARLTRPGSGWRWGGGGRGRNRGMIASGEVNPAFYEALGLGSGELAGRLEG